MLEEGLLPGLGVALQRVGQVGQQHRDPGLAQLLLQRFLHLAPHPLHHVRLAQERHQAQALQLRGRLQAGEGIVHMRHDLGQIAGLGHQPALAPVLQPVLR